MLHWAYFLHISLLFTIDKFVYQRSEDRYTTSDIHPSTQDYYRFSFSKSVSFYKDFGKDMFVDCKYVFDDDMRKLKDLSKYEVKKRLEKYSFEYFIAYSPNVSGVPTIKTKTVDSTEGSSVTQGTAYKSTATSSATYYTIYSCGCNNTVASCNAQNNIIIPLEAVVTLVKE